MRGYTRFILTLSVFSIACQLEASPIFTVPPGLTAGTPYRLVFVTFDTTQATSTSIFTYNAFVTTEADENAALAALGVTWTIIGSTAGTSALSNIGTPPGAVYDLGGVEIASSTSNLFGLSLMARINVDQFGNTVANNTAIWSGTNSGTGLGEANHQLGSTPNSGGPESGQVATGAGWLTFTQTHVNTTELQVYAISSELMVPAPEPGSLALMGLGLAAVTLGALRRGRSRGSRRA